MNNEILNTIFYLGIVLLGLPTIYFTTSSKDSSDLKRLATRIYPIVLFLIIGIIFLIYGVDNTKRAIGYAAGEAIFYLFFTIIFLIICILILLVLLTNWKMIFEEIQYYFKKK